MMGFSLKSFIDELERLLSADMKPKQRQKRLEQAVAEAKEYARICGQLN